ncbi:hypothetical protein EJB05_32885, partial [Eragrostis curvula]
MSPVRRGVLWWDVWQLRILVLGSLGLQWFLLVAAPMRKYTMPRWFRTFIWLAYISSDALAIYALATLFNRHARASSPCEYAGKASTLEVLWAPLLLVHLGGRQEITAYNIEDNELWTRHTVTLVSQVTVALYAFYKSWWPGHSDWKLLMSAILLFINGIINFCEKPWALRSASINRLVAMSSMVEGERRRPSRWQCCFTELDDRYKCWKEMPQQPAPILTEMDRVQMILSDMSLLALTRELMDPEKPQQQQSQFLLKLDPGSRPEVQLNRWLRRAFELIYTRANVICSPAYMACNFMLVPALYMGAITLFSVSHKQEYNATDIKMTYVLMCLTAALDVLGVLTSMLVYRLLSKAKVPALCQTLPEYNLVDSVLRRMKRGTGWLLTWATSCGYPEDYFRYTSGDLHIKVAGFIVTELMKPGKVEGLDLASYRTLPDKQTTTDDKEEGGVNNWALGKDLLQEYLSGNLNPSMQRSLRDVPFDQSVLLWHVATDLCFRAKPPKFFRCRPPHDELLREVCTEAISNYMAHLLHFRPEMLMTGSRKHLFDRAMDRLKDLFHDVEAAGRNNKCSGGGDTSQLVKSVGDGDQDQVMGIIEHGARDEYKAKYPLIHEACKLAKELMALPADGEKDETRWKLMHGVWTGMLCYSASRCRGYLHAKSLGEGGEFLSFVWLVISLKGAKTLADQLQVSEQAQVRPAPAAHKAQVGPAPAPTPTPDDDDQGGPQFSDDFPAI